MKISTKKKKVFSFLVTFGGLLMLDCSSIEASAEEITVYTATELQAAMLNAQPGDEITVAQGRFVGKKGVKYSGDSSASFYSAQSGTAEAPIILKGSVASILEGSGKSTGYVLYLTGDHWKIEGLTIKNGKKGIMLDNASYINVASTTVSSIGEEGIHLRDGSSFVAIDNCTITETGTYTASYGEGIYVGSDYAKWKSFDKNVHDISITNCTIGPNVRAESIDVKEGAANTLIQGNTFFGKGISGANSADSFIDVKGNDTSILDNAVYQQDNSKIKECFQVHQKQSDFGYGTVIQNNEAHISNEKVEIVGTYNKLTAEIDNNEVYK